MAARRPLGNYPSSVGAVMQSIFPHLGPTSYVQVSITPGTVPITGGDTVNAGEAGLKNFDKVEGGTTDDGAFSVSAIPISPSNPSTGVLSGIPKTTYRLKWVANKTATMGGQAQTAGSEAVAGTNLTGFCVRLAAYGI